MRKVNQTETCLVCNSKSFSGIYNNLLLKCSNCNFITYNSKYNNVFRPDKIYTEEYFKGKEYMNYELDKAIIQYNFRKKLRKIDSFIHKNKLPKINNILEIGCAYGFFGELITEKFKDAHYLGIDIVNEAINYADQELKLNAKSIDYLELPKPKKPYTDIFLWDVIEHLQYPDKILEKAYAELENKGRMYISTGDISRLLPSIQGKRWRMIHPPSHLHYFSKKTITRLCEKYGFEVEKVYYPSVTRSLKQIFYSLFLLNNQKPGNLLKGIYKLIPQKMYLSINTFDIMNIIAIKIK